MSFSSYVTIPLVFISGIWIPALALCSSTFFRRHILYLHKVTMWPGKGLEDPERLGFLKNQVAPFKVRTVDDQNLFAWLIAPLGVYARNRERFESEDASAATPIEQRTVFKCLKDDPEARLLLYFHGNAATIAQGRRTQEYRMYSSGSPNKIFVLAFDYRGFGLSTGSPSEPGALMDGVAILEWALNTAGIPPSRIVLLGHSLGTAIATAVVHHFVTLPTRIEFSGLILCAGFSNALNAFLSYAIAGAFPVLAPVKYMPPLRSWFDGRIKYSWRTDERLEEVVRRSKALRLEMVHARDDLTMPFEQTEILFKKALNALVKSDSLEHGLQNEVETLDLGEGGVQQRFRSQKKSMAKLILKSGGHDTMMTLPPVSLRVLQCFDITTDERSHNHNSA